MAEKNATASKFRIFIIHCGLKAPDRQSTNGQEAEALNTLLNDAKLCFSDAKLRFSSCLDKNKASELV